MRTFTANNIAEQLERDRATVLRALKNTPPDRTIHGRPQWKIATASRAVEAHLRAAYGNGGSNDPKLPQLIDQIEADFKAFDAGFAQLKAEPDLARRRQLDKQLGVGKLIGGLDRQMKRANAAIGEERGLSALVGEHLVGDLISRFLTLLDYWPSDAEMDRLRAEGSARHA
jgi:hypothetical protein